MNSKQKATYWNSIANEYDDMFGYNTKHGQAKIARKAEMLVRAGRITPESAVLELGCGTGVFTREIAKTARRILALDASFGMLEKAVDKGIRPNIKYRQGDMYMTPTEDESVDCVIGAYVLMYAEVSRAMRECWRVLKTRGRIAFIEPNILNPLVMVRLKVPLMRRWLKISDDAGGFAANKLKKKIVDAGFTDVVVEPIEYLSIAPLKVIGGSLLISSTKK